MVTPTTEASSSEESSSPEPVDSLPDNGDEPLVPPGLDDRFPDDTATDETDATGDEVTSDDSADESGKTSETTEETPVAEAAETPDADTTDEASTEDETSEPRVYTQEERNKQEAAYRKQFSEQETRLADMQKRVDEMQASYQNQIVDAEARAYVNALTQRYTDEGMESTQAADRATREIEAAKADWMTQQENARLRQQVQSSQQSVEETARRVSVERLMQEHGVPESQRNLLLGYTDAALAVDAAKALGEAEKLRKQQIEARQAEVPAGGEANTFDGGVGAGGSMTDDQWLETRYNTGVADTPADDLRAYKILSARGMTPQF